MTTTPHKKETNVVNLFEYMALCPECGHDKFSILVEAPQTAKDGTVKVTGTQCCACSAVMNWV